MSKPRVVVAMSGGVDSCVAAAMMLEQGFDVVGITMQLWNHGTEEDQNGTGRFDSCCSLSDVHDARRVAHRLGIPHYVVNYEDEFKRGVVDYFAAEYAAGRTPNPCVMCNSKLKFDHLLDRAAALGADKVATGHYARLVESADGTLELHRGLDDRKDQSYFLFDVKKEDLGKALFPLGDLTKAEVRRRAADLGMHTADKKESQEICFVSKGRYSDFLEQHYQEDFTGKGGQVVDTSGRVLGRHDGIHNFTVGQRKGLGHLGNTEPLYVSKIDAEKRQITVGSMTDLATGSFTVRGVNWLLDTEGEANFEQQILEVMVRYRARLVPCRVEFLGDQTVRVYLGSPARWVTPGQAAVFYQEDKLLGGGFIESTEKKSEPLTIEGKYTARSLEETHDRIHPLRSRELHVEQYEA